jgi:hypothetical protein
MMHQSARQGIPEGCGIIITHSRHVECVVLMSRVDKQVRKKPLNKGF